MKVILKEGSQKYTGEYEDGLTWGEACDLWLGVVISMFPYLNADMLADYYASKEYSIDTIGGNKDDESEDEEEGILEDDGIADDIATDSTEGVIE